MVPYYMKSAHLELADLRMNANGHAQGHIVRFASENVNTALEELNINSEFKAVSQKIFGKEYDCEGIEAELGFYNFAFVCGRDIPDAYRDTTEHIIAYVVEEYQYRRLPTVLMLNMFILKSMFHIKYGFDADFIAGTHVPHVSIFDGTHVHLHVDLSNEKKILRKDPHILQRDDVLFQKYGAARGVYPFLVSYEKINV